jgi:hypothetical protein
VVLLAVGLLVPADASAYTLVMRSGALVDVGESYRLDGSNIVYRGADGTWRTIAVVYVDLDATTRANGETVGAFVERASRRPAARAQAPAAEPAGPSVKVTNADLEPYRAERERLDAEYLARNPYTAPSAAPVPFPAASAPPAGYSVEGWVEEARALRYQIDAERAQIDGIRREISTREANPFDYALSYRYNYGNAPIVRSGGGNFYGYGSQPYLRATEEFAQLNSRLIDLEIQHRATLSRWYNLLEGARRAGIPEKYLRDAY